MIICACDPGTREGGLALLDLPPHGVAKVLAAEVFKLPAILPFMAAARAYAARIAMVSMHSHGCIYACEVTQFMGARSNSKQMHELTLLAGCLCGMLNATPLDPCEWRDAIYKPPGNRHASDAEVHAALRLLRIEQQLPPIQRGVLAQEQRAHMLDAVGIAWVAGTLAQNAARNL